MNEEQINMFDSDEKGSILNVTFPINVDLEKVVNGSVAFTGNRPNFLPWKYNEQCELCAEYKKHLKEFIYFLIANGYNHFYVGMALGFDTIVAELLLSVKETEHCNITVECALPCLNQSSRWSFEQKERYNNILSRVDKVTYVSEKYYFNGCCQERNKFMVDNSMIVVAGLFKGDSGTANTIEYAIKQKKKVFVINRI